MSSNRWRRKKGCYFRNWEVKSNKSPHLEIKDHLAGRGGNGTMLKPFLRWAGGKQVRIRHIAGFLPKGIITNTYFEPFLGAGSMFFYLRPEKAVLSDLNEHLIHCFDTIRHSPDKLSDYLIQHGSKCCEEYYYSVRDAFNRHIDRFTISQAARFIYLNRACFNGIFRVNMKGQFNVPYGFKNHLFLPDKDKLRKVSALLANTEIFCQSYENILDKMRPSDLVYLDPPYPPINGSSYFTHYTKDRFHLDDQKKLRDFVLEVDNIGCKFLLSNADLDYIRHLYKKWNIYPTQVTRYISCKSNKHKVSELLIANYDI